MQPIEVTALTAGEFDPSRRFRICQFVDGLKKRGIDVTELHPFFSKYAAAPIAQLGFIWTAGKIFARMPGVAAARSADITWLQRELIPGRFTLERYAGRRILLDIDDAVWMDRRGEEAIEQIAKHSSGVIAGNNFLGDFFRQRGLRVWIVPTSVDTERWKPSSTRAHDKWTIGWSGTTSNLNYLYSIEEPLSDFLASHQDAELLVVSDSVPTFNHIPAGRWRFEPWSPDREVDFVQQMDVGLMPLAFTDWERGKCGLKMLTYMAVGLPTVASPVGISEDIIRQSTVGLLASSNHDWYQALETLHRHSALGRRMGESGRQLVEAEYSVSHNVDKLAEIFRQVAHE